MSKPHHDPNTGRFIKRSANPPSSSSLASSSAHTPGPLVFPTLHSHPIPDSFNLPASPDHISEVSDPKFLRSPNKSTSFTTFFNALQHTQSLSPNPQSPESQILSTHSGLLNDTKTLVPVSCSIVDLLDCLAAQEAQEPSPIFAYTSSTLQPPSDSLPLPPSSSVSSVITSQSSYPGLAPLIPSVPPLFASLSSLLPDLSQPSPSYSVMTASQSQPTPSLPATTPPLPLAPVLPSTPALLPPSTPVLPPAPAVIPPAPTPPAPPVAPAPIPVQQPQNQPPMAN